MRYATIILFVLAGLQAARGGYLSAPLFIILALGGCVGAIMLRKA
ncbi:MULTISPECIES: hypothetical protein [unclassified Bradyrhizobium]|nr:MULTISPECIES: hypothetical protein [unclassified Bradyrhizobium]WFU77391.1 hypothetical protein QA645_22825 [Bradyrhizobium sp. CIAT3101]